MKNARVLLQSGGSADVHRVRSAYYPRYRPRRLVMPVDPNDVHHSKRERDQLNVRIRNSARVRRESEKRGALKLSVVPSERSVADAFNVMLQTCEQEKLFSREHFCPPAQQELKEALSSFRTAYADAKKSEAAAAAAVPPASDSAEVVPASRSPFYEVVLSADRELPEGETACASPSHGGSRALQPRQVDALWDLLQRTPLNSPVHGVLAQRGRALTERVVADAAYDLYPRMRSAHLQALLRECCGLLPCARVALRLGFADVSGVGAECSMWRELNVLEYRLQTARRQAAAHLERVEKGVTRQRRWYWRAVTRSAGARLRMMPFRREDLQPRIEWVRDSVFAFIAFAEIAQRSGDSGVNVRTLILRLFCSQIATFADGRRRLEEAAEALAATEGQNTAAVASARQRVSSALRRCRSLSQDAEDLANERVHPLNDRAARARDQIESSGGAHATTSLRDDVFEEQHVRRHRHQAPPLVLSALQTTNAFKEAQLVLKYAPDVSATLRNAPIDVDEVVRKVIDVNETNSYASLYHQQQFRAVEYSVCRLYAGKTCIGEGKGETLMQGIQEASQDMLFNYYLGVHSSDPSAVDSADEGNNTTSTSNTKGLTDASDLAAAAASSSNARVEEEFRF